MYEEGFIVKLFDWCIKNAGKLNKSDEYNKYVKVNIIKVNIINIINM